MTPAPATTPADLADRLAAVAAIIATFAAVARTGVIDKRMLDSGIAALETAHEMLTAIRAAKPAGRKLQ